MPIDYPSFRRRSWDERIQLFNSIPNDEKAELVRTHIRAWLESHRAELTPEQISMVEENISLITADLYDTSKRAENQGRLKEMEMRTATWFTRDQMREAFTMHWECPAS